MTVRIRVYLRADNVKRVLAKKNQTDEWLAKQLQTSKQYLWQMMNGHRCPSPAMRKRISKLMLPKEWDFIFRLEELDDSTDPNR